ncbi:MAG: DUF2892 domain-containing protein [Paracoccaceae bacterium]|nr:DUF2892 domain-containing protein [Paracoccaceae bacterium]MDE3121359.1 DUF2892 domain-containing protein [Paracoccaceae bacterium]MDE3238940.1 DUF2892 domain-containing protein [Paracoccaceae bacterium]
MFKTNVGLNDRIVRIIIGVVLLGGYFFSGALGGLHWLLLIGVVPLLTGIFATCPLYSVLGMSTCPMKR